MPPGPLSVRLEVRLATDDGLDDAAVNGLVQRAVRRSPVSEALGRIVPIDVDVKVVDSA